MKRLFISDEYPCFCDELKNRGYEIIPTKKIDVFHKPEQRHADMQLLKIEDSFFTLDDCIATPGKSYPENILLNCLYFGGKLYCKLIAVDVSVTDFCRERGIDVINVNQGYTRCSALIVSDSAVVTADKSIYKALKTSGAEALLINPGNIRLEGFEYGFIGGAGFYDDSTVYIFGNIKEHPDYDSIRMFCSNYNSKLEIICPSEPLTDIGGAVVLD